MGNFDVDIIRIMNEQEALDICENNKFAIDWNCDDGIVFRAFVKRILKEIQQYREIGTTEECQVAVNKQKPHKLSYEGDGNDDAGNMIYDTAICPNCGKHFEADYDEHSNYCPDCGCRIDWSVEE